MLELILKKAPYFKWTSVSPNPFREAIASGLLSCGCLLPRSRSKDFPYFLLNPGGGGVGCGGGEGVGGGGRVGTDCLQVWMCVYTMF